jgi:hypothetical protein
VHEGMGINIVATNGLETNDDNNIVLNEEELSEVYEQEKVVNNVDQNDIDNAKRSIKRFKKQEKDIKVDNNSLNDVNNESLSINISTKRKMKTKKSKNGNPQQPKFLDEDIENYEEKVTEQIEQKRKIELSKATEKMQAKMLKTGRCPY